MVLFRRWGGKTKALVHAAEGSLLFCARKEEKILPSDVIRDALDEKIEKIEQEQDRQVFSKEKRALKDDVLMELLPKAFTRSKYTTAYIDTQAGLLIINASASNQAEELTSTLRYVLGSLPVTPAEIKHVPAFIMTEWLTRGGLPDGFVLGSSCDLREPGDAAGKITARHEDLETEAIEQHLTDGKQVSRLGIDWNEQLSCVLCDDLSVKQLKFSDDLKDQVYEQDLDTREQQQDANFVLMASVLRQFLKQWVAALN